MPDARVSAPLAWDEVPDCEPGAFTIDTVPERFTEIGDPSEGIDAAAGSLEPLLALAADHEAAGFGDAPWPPQFEKAEGEPPRVQPSRRKRSGGKSPAKSPATKGSTTKGRRRSSMPLIEIARASTEAEAKDGLQRWKERHPDVW